MLRYRKWSHTPLEDISGKIKFWWKNKIISAFFKINHSHWQLGLEAQFFYPIVIGNLAVPIFCFNFPVSFWDVCGLNYDSFHRLWHFLVWAWRGNAQPPVKLWCFSNVESRLVEFSRAHQYFLSKSFKTLTSSNSLLWDSFASTSFLITFKCFSLSGIDCAWMVTKQYWPLKDEFLEATPMHWSKSPSWLMLPFKAPLGNFAFASNTENLSIWEMAESTYVNDLLFNAQSSKRFKDCMKFSKLFLQSSVKLSLRRFDMKLVWKRFIFWISLVTFWEVAEQSAKAVKSSKSGPMPQATKISHWEFLPFYITILSWCVQIICDCLIIWLSNYLKYGHDVFKTSKVWDLQLYLSNVSIV